MISTLQYGTRLLTSKLNSADTDNLEIVYENPKQLELVTSEVSLAVKSEKIEDIVGPPYPQINILDKLLYVTQSSFLTGSG